MLQTRKVDPILKLWLSYIYITLYNRVPQRAARVQESPDGGGRLSPIM